MTSLTLHGTCIKGKHVTVIFFLVFFLSDYCHVFQEWSAEGYQLWMVKRQPDHDPGGNSSVDCVIQLDFVKSALTVNPCMVRIHILLLVSCGVSTWGVS